MRLMCLFMAAALFLSACTGMPGSGPLPAADQLQAENRMMKNNLKLALRENEVLKEENRQYKSETARINARMAGLMKEIADLTARYEEDMDHMAGWYQDLVRQHAEMENRDREQISELMIQMEDVQNAWDDDAIRLNLELREQTALSEATRNLIEADFQKKRSEFESKTAELNRRLSEKQTILENLESAVENLQAQLEQAQSACNEKEDRFETLDKNYQTLLESHRNLQKLVDDKQARIEEMNKNYQSLLECIKPGIPHSD